MKKLLSLTLFLCLLLSLLSTAPAVSAEQIVATEEDVILLAGSDFQVGGNNTAHVENLLDVLALHGLTRADGAFMVGDYTPNARETNTSSEGIAVLKEVFRPVVGENVLFTQGNHDHNDTVGLAKDGNNDPASGKYGVFVINENQRMEFNYTWTYDTTKQAADDLKAYLDDKVAKGFTKPIFVLNHIPLHWGNRTIEQGNGAHAELLVKVLNEAGAKGLNIIYLYGHNHGSGYDDALGNAAVYLKKGDQMEVCISDPATAQKKLHTTYTLNFTYMNAGYIGSVNSPDSAVDCALTMSVFLIRGDEVIITRYDEEINLAKNKFGIHDLKSPGKWIEKYSQEGYHATPNTTRYASSRKVTATSDVEVESPRYSAVEEDEWEDDEVITTTTTTQKHIATTTKATSATTTSSSVVTTVASETATTTGTPVVDEQPDESVTASLTTTTSVTSTAETTTEDGEEVTVTIPETPFSIASLFGVIGGAILVVDGIVFWFMLKRKK